MRTRPAPGVDISGSEHSEPLYPFPPLCMDTSKTKKESPAAKAARTAVSTAAPAGPVKVFRLDDVSVSIFARQRQLRGEAVTFYSASFSRSYKDAAGAWKYTRNFDPADLAKLVTLAQQANEYIEETRQAQAA